jgi:hypothetical protein
VKGQKNDYNDAEAIAEAALRPNLRFVQEKSQDQLDESVAVNDRRSELLGQALSAIEVMVGWMATSSRPAISGCWDHVFLAVPIGSRPAAGDRE